MGKSALLLALCLAAGCRPAATPPPPPAPLVAPEHASKGDSPIFGVSPGDGGRKSGQSPRLAGSKSCRDCHEDFYKLWSTSHHGLAMQPYTAAFAKAELQPPHDDVVIGKQRYRAEIRDDGGWVRQSGPDGQHQYPILHVMGGKNVYYFLTSLPRGRLQVLPVAYDVHKRTWYDTAASGVRHFAERRDEALDWTDRLFTFNTTCFNCHVSELSTNYDLATDSYHTTWAEAGISCESCHGSGKEHVRVMEAAADAQPPKAVKDIKIIRSKQFSALQMNDMCATCHAKLVALSTSFTPGERFFDHYDLVCLDHPDYYPDGRDLGENYTYTSWLMSPCARSGKLDCNHCHTPSGRPRFEGAESNQACLPCHAQQCQQAAAHSHHAAGTPGSRCVDCHMPMTRFAAMGRSDHSMRPPTPATTLAYKSPNACNLCHADHPAAWADQWVRKWYGADYQAPVLRRAQLLDAARKQQWQRLPEMLAAMSQGDDAVYKASLVRLLRGCNDPRKQPVLLESLHDASPLVRSSAVSTLGDQLTPEVAKALLVATADPSRLVRIRSAMALAGAGADWPPDERQRRQLARATDDFLAAMKARPDDWASYANLGNFHMQRGDFAAAAASFETASKLEPRVLGPHVNAAIAYSNLRQTDKAEAALRRALAIEPANAAANFNLGLLLAEQSRLPEAEQALRAAWKADPQMAPAAYNLGVLLAERDVAEAVAWCRKAYQLGPHETKYAHTLAFYLRQKGDTQEAVGVLREVLAKEPSDWEGYLLLGELHQQRHEAAAAAAIYRVALKKGELPGEVRRELETRLRKIEMP